VQLNSEATVEWEGWTEDSDTGGRKWHQ